MAKFSKSVAQPQSRLRDVRPAGPDFGLGMALNAVTRVGESAVEQIVENKAEGVVNDFTTGLTNLGTPEETPSGVFADGSKKEDTKSVQQLKTGLGNVDVAIAQGKIKPASRRAKASAFYTQSLKANPKQREELTKAYKDFLLTDEGIRLEDAQEKVDAAATKARRTQINGIITKAIDTGDTVLNEDGSINENATIQAYAKEMQREGELNDLKEQATNPALRAVTSNRAFLNISDGTNLKVVSKLAPVLKSLKAQPDAKARLEVAGDAAKQLQQFFTGENIATDRKLSAMALPLEDSKAIKEKLVAQQTALISLFTDEFEAVARAAKGIEDATKLDMLNVAPILSKLSTILGPQAMQSLALADPNLQKQFREGSGQLVDALTNDVPPPASSVLGSDAPVVPTSGTTARPPVSTGKPSVLVDPVRSAINLNTLVTSVQLFDGTQSPRDIGRGQMAEILPGITKTMKTLNTEIGKDSPVEQVMSWMRGSNTLVESYFMSNKNPQDRARAMSQFDFLWLSTFRETSLNKATAKAHKEVGVKVNRMANDFLTSELTTNMRLRELVDSQVVTYNKDRKMFVHSSDNVNGKIDTSLLNDALNLASATGGLDKNQIAPALIRPKGVFITEDKEVEGVADGLGNAEITTTTTTGDATAVDNIDNSNDSSTQ